MCCWRMNIYANYGEVEFSQLLFPIWHYLIKFSSLFIDYLINAFWQMPSIEVMSWLDFETPILEEKVCIPTSWAVWVNGYTTLKCNNTRRKRLSIPTFQFASELQNNNWKITQIYKYIKQNEILNINNIAWFHLELKKEKWNFTLYMPKNGRACP